MKKNREVVKAWREGNGRVKNSHVYTDPGRSSSTEVHNHLECFYKEANLSVDDPGPDYCPKLTDKEKAELLVAWDKQYRNSTRISTCASCGRRDCDDRPVEKIYVPVADLADVFEIKPKEYEDLEAKGRGLYHLMKQDGRCFHLIERGTRWITRAQREQLYGASSSGGGREGTS